MSETALPLPQTTRHTPLSLGDAFALIVPILQFIQVKTVGTLYVTDIALMVCAPLVVARSLPRLKEKQILKYLLFCFVWLGAQVVTDVLRGSAPADYLRVWSKIGLTITHFAVIWLLLRKSVRRFILFGIGLAIGNVLSTSLSPSLLAEDDPWKYGYGALVTLLCVMASAWLSERMQSKTVLAVAMGSLSAFNVYMGFRSLAGVCLMALAYSYFQLSSQRLRRRIGRLQLAMAAGVVVLSGWALLTTYAFGAQQGWFGREAETKYRMQSRGAGLLLGGRSEIFASSAAILDSPFIGHGSWAKDPQYDSIMRLRKAEMGYKDSGADTKSEGLIPTHSHLFGAWVEAGIGGAVFWVWVLSVTIGAMRRVTGLEPMLPVFAFIGLLLSWDVLFSPYGAEQRFIATYSVAAMLILDSITKSIRTSAEAEEVQA